MKRGWSWGASSVLFVLLSAGGASAKDSSGGAPDELLVGLRSGVPNERLEEILREEGGVRVKRVPGLRVYRVRARGVSEDDLKGRLASRGEVEFVERNAEVSPEAVVNDPNYAWQGYLPKIGVDAAWSLTTGSSEVVIAILDSGIDGTHPDLAAKLLPGWNLYDGNADTTDVYGHGTKVAGAAAALTNNGIGVAGVAWQNPLLPVRVTNTSGTAYLSTIAQGLTWAVDHGARVMNVSFAGVAGSSTVTAAAQYVRDRGGIVVASAGNCSCDDPTPENPYILSVAATDPNDQRASFSSRGNHVDVAAPGTNVLTTLRGGTYGTTAGTSIASPIAAGVVALMWSANPGISPDEVVELLESTALDLGTTGYDTSFGFGRIDAHQAVLAAANSSPPPPDSTPPAVAIQNPTAGTIVSGTILVEIAAFDDRGAVAVELYDGDVLVGRDMASPFSFAWNTSAGADGSRTLVAVAIDASGNEGLSEPVTVEASNAATAAAPLVAILSPGDGTSVSRTVSIDAVAEDDAALARIDVLADGKVIGGGVCSASACRISVRWNTKKASRGIHELRAAATDAAGQRSTSSAVYVTVEN